MLETTPSALPTQEEHRRQEQLWRRVSPSLPPYGAAPPEPACRSGGEREAELLRNSLQDELADAQTYRCLAALAHTAEGRRLMCSLASDEAAHAKRLQAAYFLLTGEICGATVVLPPQPRLLWRDRLRERYREECCGAARYAQAAAMTADVCLAHLLQDLSADEYRHASLLQKQVEKTI